MARQVRIGSVILDFRLNAAEFEHKAKAIRKELRVLKAETRKITQTFRRFAIAGAAATTALGYFGRRISADVSELIKLSNALRGNVADLQILERSAEIAGSTFTNMQVALRRMELTLGKIAGGLAETQLEQTWQRLGLNIQDVISLPIDQRFETIAQAVRDFIPAAEQAAAMAQFLGARADLELLGIRPEVFQQARAELTELGGGLGRVATRDVGAMEESIKELNFTFRNFFRDLAAEHAPAIRKWADDVTASLKPGGLLRDLMKGLSESFRLAMLAAAEFIDAMNSIFGRATLVAVAIAGISSAVLNTTASIIGMVGGLKNLWAIIKEGTLVTTTFTAKMGILRAALRTMFPLLAGIGVAYGVISAAIGLFNRNQAGLIDQTRAATQSVRGLSEAYDSLKNSLAGVSDANREMTATARAAMQAEIDRTRLRATFEEAGLWRSPEFLDVSQRIKDLQEARERNLAARQRFEDGKVLTTTRGVFARAFRERNDAALKEIGEALRAAEDKRRALFNNVDYLRGEAERFQELLDNLAGNPAAANASGRAEGYFDAWGHMRATEEALAAYEQRLGEFRRTFEDAGGHNTSVFNELQQAKRWHEDITREINEAGFAYQHLHAEAAIVYEDLKRRAQGMTTPFENLVTIADTLKDRFRSVTDSIVDHWVDGTTKISDAFKKMALQVAKDMLWLNIRAGLSRIGGGIFGGLGGAGVQVPGMSPSLALGDGGTINVSGITGYAMGGRTPGGWAVVGERGPELAHFDGPASIFSNADSRRMAGGSLDVNIGVHPGGSWQEFHANVIGAIESKAPDIVNAANAAVMQNMQRSSNMQTALRRGM